MKALLNSKAHFHSHLTVWVIKITQFDEESGFTSREAFWTALEVDVDMMRCFERVNPRHDPLTGILRASRSLRGAADSLDAVEHLLLYCHTWVIFVDTRFAGIGRCGRKWALSCAVGLDSLYEQVAGDNKVSKYYLNGYKRLGKRGRQWLAVASLSCYPIESLV